MKFVVLFFILKDLLLFQQLLQPMTGIEGSKYNRASDATVKEL